MLIVVGDQEIAITAEAIGRGSVGATFGLESGESFGGPGSDQLALKLGEYGCHGGHCAPLGRAEIEPIGDADQTDPTAGEAVEMAEGLCCISTQSVQARDHHRIDFGYPLFEQPGDPRAAFSMSQVTSPGHSTVFNYIEEGRIGGLRPCLDPTTLCVEANAIGDLLF
jgi:hypothetical protein